MRNLTAIRLTRHKLRTCFTLCPFVCLLFQSSCITSSFSDEQLPRQTWGKASFQLIWMLQCYYYISCCCFVGYSVYSNIKAMHYFNYWRSALKKALSDSRSDIKFPLPLFTRKHKVIWKENLAVYQKSLRAIFLDTPSIVWIQCICVTIKTLLFLNWLNLLLKCCMFFYLAVTYSYFN